MSGNVDFGKIDLSAIKLDVISKAINNHKLLNSAFKWEESPQGFMYWHHIFETGHTDESLLFLKSILRYLHVGNIDINKNMNTDEFIHMTIRNNAKKGIKSELENNITAYMNTVNGYVLQFLYGPEGELTRLCLVGHDFDNNICSWTCHYDGKTYNATYDKFDLTILRSLVDQRTEIDTDDVIEEPF